MISELEDGVLPEGIHVCTMAEVEQVFGKFQRSDRRIRLTEKLQEFVEEARRSGIVAAVIINGSYVTAKAEPSDIDLIVALRADLDGQQDLRPVEHNVQSKRVLRQKYRFDVKVALDGSTVYQEAVAFFAVVRPDDPMQKTSRTYKGLLRIEL
jgi:hypothetical protein